MNLFHINDAVSWYEHYAGYFKGKNGKRYWNDFRLMHCSYENKMISEKPNFGRFGQGQESYTTLVISSLLQIARHQRAELRSRIWRLRRRIECWLGKAKVTELKTGRLPAIRAGKQFLRSPFISFLFGHNTYVIEKSGMFSSSHIIISGFWGLHQRRSALVARHQLIISTGSWFTIQS